MNTPAILNPAAAPRNHVSGARQADASSSDAQFNHVLSREIADRNSASEVRQPGAREPSNSSAPDPASGKAGTKKADKEKSGERNDKATADSAATAGSAVPAEMLALVANLGHLTADNATAKADTTSVSAVLTEGAAAHSKLVGPVIKDDGGARKDTVEIPLDGKSAGAKAKDIDTDDSFAAAAKQARDAKQEIEPATAGKIKGEPAELPAAAVQVDIPLEALTAKDQEIQPASAATTAAPLQLSALNNAQALTGHATEKLSPQVGTPAWEQALGQKVVWMVAGGQQSASLTLNPPDLGPLQVVLNVSNSQATANFIAAQPEVREALESAMPKLREMLGDAGIQLGQTTVGAGMPNQNHAPGQQETQKTGRSSDDAVVDTTDTSIRMPRGRTISSGQGLVDTFV